MKLLIIKPVGMANSQAEVMNDVLSWGDKGNVVRTKPVIVSGELAAKHFDFLPEDQRALAVQEWSGATVRVLMLNSIPEGKAEQWANEVYISPDDERADRDLKLWFPEYFI